jgi:DNA-binding NarL/FixJ family response regulator
MTMPELTGDRLAREINKIRSDIPIILCTGFSEKISPENVKQFGIHKYLMKPVSMGELAKTVRSTIDRVESK